jgi:crotonobetainyl-CoA:carnitine CoA-transferase CaiB-like acyl-CoA transferase
MLRQRSTEDWIAILHQHGVPCGPILNLKQVFEHPQVLHNQMVVTLDNPVAGPRRLLGIPLKLRDTPGEIRTPAPALGQHSQELLLSLGYSMAQIATLWQEGAI